MVFYAWGEPVWIALLLFTAFFDYLNALLAERFRGRWLSLAAVVFSISLNLTVLGFFKYSGFLVQNINFLLHTHIAYRQFSLPLGISFYTFQSISYVVDVYRGAVAAQKSPFKFLLYVALFHHLVAGPIIRYKDIAHEIDKRVITVSLFSEGVSRFAVGLAKKVIIANNVGEVADIFLKGNLSDLSILGAWFGATLFTLQIYFDFSGYSDMAIGLGKMFGFHYKENFNYPYIARSATEFWRRWHISLGSFFRDYVYIPLGGKKSHMLRNLLIVWFLTGLWHGASWNFILWGLYYGLLILIEKEFLLKVLNKIPRFFSHVYLIVAAIIGWVFFYYTDLGKAFQLLKTMFGISTQTWINTDFSVFFANNVILFGIAVVACIPIKQLLKQLVSRLDEKKSAAAIRWAKTIIPAANLVLLAVSTILLVGQTYNPFLYFRF